MAKPARPVADAHDLIRVQGARVNNLKDVSVEIPKRRLTVFTGVSGSGKSSLVFGTIAAESQRLINETYSAFLQGFMPSMARPDVDVLDGLTTAIIVDQERMAANARSTVGTATDANAMLRILFSKLDQPSIGGPNAFSFNVASSGAHLTNRWAGVGTVFTRVADWDSGDPPHHLPVYVRHALTRSTSESERSTHEQIPRSRHG
jgi:energy-coupling factor transporter ATP-binding protein EcfA2